jgi:Ca-activated chloride channel family protein
MISFAHPLFFVLLCALPLYAVLLKTRILGRIEFPLTIGDWDGSPFRWNSPALRFARFVAVVFFVAAFGLAVTAAAGPVRFIQERMYSGNGAGIIFALDVSPSMAARDMQGGSRLEAAKSGIRSFAAQRPGDSLGLVAIGSDAALLVPPTRDEAAFLSRLDSLSIGELGDGSAIGLGLAVAAAHLVDRQYSRSAVILMTDGENNAGEIHPNTAARLYHTHGISLFVTGIGTRGEVPVDYTDPSTGNRVTGMLSSEFSENALKEIADAADGYYLSSPDSASLEYVFDLADESVPPAASSWTRTMEQRFEQPLLAAALVLFALSWIVRRLVMGALI